MGRLLLAFSEVPKARPGSRRAEDTPRPTASPTSPRGLPAHPPACPLHLPMNSISLSSLKTTEL